MTFLNKQVLKNIIIVRSAVTDIKRQQDEADYFNPILGMTYGEYCRYEKIKRAKRGLKMTELLYIDLFCGAGGTSTGVERARLNGEKCARVIACVNHDPNAIKSHAANHPNTKHFTEDIRTLDMKPLQAITDKERAKNPGAKVVLWASLECTNFSKAKGGQLSSIDDVSPAILTVPKQKLVTVNQFIVNTSYKSAGCSIDEPACTIIARMDKSPLYLATVKEGKKVYTIKEGDTKHMRLIKAFMKEFGIVDIYMRMLSVKELKTAQGFPEDYILCGTQTEQKKFIGNAVECHMSQALCEALANELNR